MAFSMLLRASNINDENQQRDFKILRFVFFFWLKFKLLDFHVNFLTETKKQMFNWLKVFGETLQNQTQNCPTTNQTNFNLVTWTVKHQDPIRNATKSASTMAFVRKTRSASAPKDTWVGTVSKRFVFRSAWTAEIAVLQRYVHARKDFRDVIAKAVSNKCLWTDHTTWTQSRRSHLT